MADFKNNSPEMFSSLSAMFDGEASDQDIERLLKADQAALSHQLESFHLVQQTLHKDSNVAVGLQGDLVSRIRTKIDAEDAALDREQGTLKNAPLPFLLPEKNKNSRPIWQVMLSSVAVAASVTFVVIFGGNVLLAPDAIAPNLMANVHSPVDNLVVTPLAELNKDALLVDNVRLQNYLRQHAEQAAMTVGQGMIPMARVVSYPIKE